MAERVVVLVEPDPAVSEAAAPKPAPIAAAPPDKIGRAHV